MAKSNLKRASQFTKAESNVVEQPNDVEHLDEVVRSTMTSDTDAPSTSIGRPLVIEQRHTMSLDNSKRRRASACSNMFIPKELARMTFHQSKKPSPSKNCTSFLKFRVVGGDARRVADELKRQQHIAVTPSTARNNKEEAGSARTEATDVSAKDLLTQSASNTSSTARPSAPVTQSPKILCVSTNAESAEQQHAHDPNNGPATKKRRTGREMLMAHRAPTAAKINVDLSAMTSYETALQIAQKESIKIQSIKLLKDKKLTPSPMPPPPTPPAPVTAAVTAPIPAPAPLALSTPLQSNAQNDDEMQLIISKLAQKLFYLLEVPLVLSSDEDNSDCHNILTLAEFQKVLKQNTLFNALLSVKPMNKWIWHHLDYLIGLQSPEAPNTNQQQELEQKQQQPQQQKTQQAELQQKAEQTKWAQKTQQTELQQKTQRKIRARMPQQPMDGIDQLIEEIKQQQQQQMLQQQQQQMLQPQQPLKRPYIYFKTAATGQDREQQREQYLERCRTMKINPMQQKKRNSPLNEQQPSPLASTDMSVPHTIAVVPQQQQQHVEATLEQLANIQNILLQQQAEKSVQFEASMNKIQSDRNKCEAQLSKAQRSLDLRLTKLEKEEIKLCTDKTKSKQTFAEQLQKLDEVISQQTERLKEQQLALQSQQQPCEVNQQNIHESRLQQQQPQPPQQTWPLSLSLPQPLPQLLPQPQPVPQLLPLFNMQSTLRIQTPGASTALEQPQHNNTRILFQNMPTNLLGGEVSERRYLRVLQRRRVIDQGAFPQGYAGATDHSHGAPGGASTVLANRFDLQLPANNAPEPPNRAHEPSISFAVKRK